MIYASNDAQIFGFDIFSCLFMVSHYIFDALDVFFFILDLFFFRSILDGSQYLEKLIHILFTFERLVVFKVFITCLQKC